MTPELDAAVRRLAGERAFPSGRDRDFFSRVFQTPKDVYEARLRAIGFAGHDRVLDAASGFGQWSLALAKLNTHVDLFDYSPFRVGLSLELARAAGVDNLQGAVSSLDALPYADESFDAAFCYSAIFAVDYRKALAEFRRVLRADGVLYFMTSSIGWYVHNLVRGHNDSKDFSSRRAAALNLRASALYYLKGTPPPPEVGVMIPQRAARRRTEAAGFRVVALAGDGQIGAERYQGLRSFYRARYFGLPGVYEVLATKTRPSR